MKVILLVAENIIEFVRWTKNKRHDAVSRVHKMMKFMSDWGQLKIIPKGSDWEKGILENKAGQN